MAQSPKGTAAVWWRGAGGGTGSLSGLSVAIDVALALIVGAAFAVFALGLFGQLDYSLLSENHNYWLDSDPRRIINGLTDRWSDEHARSNLHPLWAFFFATPSVVLTQLIGAHAAVTFYVAMSAFIFGGAFQITARRIGLGRGDSLLACALFASTSTAWFWFGMPESFVVGGATVLAPLVWLTLPRSRLDDVLGPVASMISLTTTLTNWFAGILAAFLRLGWRGCIAVSMGAFALGAALAVLQSGLFPGSGRYFDVFAEITFLRGEGYSKGDSGSVIQHLQAYLLHPISAPVPDLLTPALPEWADMLSRFQLSAIAHTPAGLLNLVIWAGLIAVGVQAARKQAVSRDVALFIAGVVAFNLVLHMAYGPETFLYAMHWMPLVTLAATFALAGSPYRNWVRGLVVAAVVLGVIHNGSVFQDMAAWHNTLPPPPPSPWDNPVSVAP